MEISGLVSIIMLSKNNGKNVVDSVKSVQAQTYENWELLFLDDNSTDDTISQVLQLKETDSRISVSTSAYERGVGVNRLAALKYAKGEWIAFLDSGDLWEPDKLEKQIAFMNQNDYYFSYTKYKMVDERLNQAYIITGPAEITSKEMRKCSWVGALTVVLKHDLVNLQNVKVLNVNNDYAIWLQACDKTNCYLLDECLAQNMIRRGFLRRLSFSSMMKWRYEVYRIIEDLSPIVSSFMTIRNLYYSIIRRIIYFKHTSF